MNKLHDDLQTKLDEETKDINDKLTDANNRMYAFIAISPLI